MRAATRVLTYMYLTLIGFSTVTAITGCSTYQHEPMCKCDCNDNNSSFECGGVIYHEEIELKP